MNQRDCFDEAAYLAAYPDVANAVRRGQFRSGWAHFQRFGRDEGRSGCPPAKSPRVAKAMQALKHDGFGLEIGPSHNPVAPKRLGYKVHIMDHVSTDELRAKYAGHAALGVDIGNIEEVDFVWRGQPLEELVGGKSRYDWIIASHVIEHLPDPVRFFQQCAAILKPDGRLSLIVPDKRYCFDYFGQITSTGEWLDAYAERRVRPTPGKVFDHIANAARRNGAIAWSAEARGALELNHTFAQARALWESAQGSDYIDVHSWRFTPESFRLIVSDLRGLGMIEFGVHLEFDTSGCEFYVTMERAAPAPAADRLETLAEIRNRG